MRRILSWVIASAWVLTIGATVGNAQIIAQHSGASDPTTEGWRYLSQNSPIVGPVTNDQNSGADAWSLSFPSNIFNTTQGVYVVENIPLANAALANGWELTANLRFAVLPHNSQFFINVSFPDFRLGGTYGPSGYGLLFLPNLSRGGVDLFLTSSLTGGAPLFYAGLPVQLPNPTAYHLFQIQYDPIAKSADLFVDGSLKFSNFVGEAGNFNHTEWVLGSRPADTSAIVGQVNVSDFQLVVVPEPSTLTLLALGAAALAASRVHRSHNLHSTVG